MGKVNIRGGSPLHLSFEDGNEESPKDFDVELVRHGNTYHVVRTANRQPLETRGGDAAKMRVTNQSPRWVEVLYDEQ